MDQPSAEERILRFLREHRRGRLEVLTGYVSVWGLAWLQENTAHRATTVLVGDLRKSRFGNATPEQRRLAAEFLNRSDTELRVWYTKKKAKSRKEDIMHAKAWITRGRKTACLLGSANLTQQGLKNNFELMAEPAKYDLPAVADAAATILSKSYLATDRVAEYINQTPTTPSEPAKSRDALDSSVEMNGELGWRSTQPGPGHNRKRRRSAGVGW